MSLRVADLTVFVFILGVMLSGIWLAQQLGMAWSPTLSATVTVVTAVWTAYYWLGVEPRIDVSRGDGNDNQQEPGVNDGAQE